MVQVAERTSILDQEADKILLIERANHLWDRQAIFDWEMVAVSSYNSSVISDDDSIDDEGNGLDFKSPRWEVDVANYYTETDPPFTPQQPFFATELFACQPAPLLSPASARCIMCKGPLTGSFCLYCMSDSDPRETLFNTSHMTRSAGDHMDPRSGIAAPKGLPCAHVNVRDALLVRTDKTAQESRQGFVEGWTDFPDWEAIAPGHTQLAGSSSAPPQGTAVSATILFMKETPNVMPVLSECQNLPRPRATPFRLHAKTEEPTGLRKEAFFYCVRRHLVFATPLPNQYPRISLQEHRFRKWFNTNNSLGSAPSCCPAHRFPKEILQKARQARYYRNVGLPPSQPEGENPNIFADAHSRPTLLIMLKRLLSFSPHSVSPAQINYTIFVARKPSSPYSLPLLVCLATY